LCTFIITLKWVNLLYASKWVQWNAIVYAIVLVICNEPDFWCHHSPPPSFVRERRNFLIKLLSPHAVSKKRTKNNMMGLIRHHLGMSTDCWYAGLKNAVLVFFFSLHLHHKDNFLHFQLWTSSFKTKLFTVSAQRTVIPKFCFYVPSWTVEARMYQMYDPITRPIVCVFTLLMQFMPVFFCLYEPSIPFFIQQNNGADFSRKEMLATWISSLVFVFFVHLIEKRRLGIFREMVIWVCHAWWSIFDRNSITFFRLRED
jgi:hypothetical protein